MGSAWRSAHDDYIQTQVILHGIQKLRQVSPQVDQFMNELGRYGNLILVGGAVRDLAERKTPRDYDIIVDSSDAGFEAVFAGRPYQRNRFGGYKLHVDGIEFDIWGIENNWAFRESLFVPHFENIPKGAFFNFDALCFHLHWQSLECTAFKEAMESQMLDILLDDAAVRKNPTPEVNVVRAWVIHKTRGLQLSDRVRKYIHEWCANAENPREKLLQAERKHYGENSPLSHDDYDQLLLHMAIS